MPTKAQRRKALEILLTDLYDTFKGITTRIRGRPNASAKLGMRALMWLHFAQRPLKLIELQHALSVQKGHIEFDPDYLPSPKVFLDCCLGLVLVDETSTVRFMHFILEEYFGVHARTEFPNRYSSIAETCLTYFNFGKLRQPCKDIETLYNKMTEYALLDYAALYWGTYVKQQCTDDITKLVRMLVENESECPPCAIQALYLRIGTSDYYNPTTAKKFSGIHVIAYFRLVEHMSCFTEVELEDDTGKTPLL